MIDDTDIAVMLVHHCHKNMAEVYFLQERWSKAWSVKDASSRNEVIKEHLLFLHSWSLVTLHRQSLVKERPS